jgi:hypothetical protein
LIIYCKVKYSRSINFNYEWVFLFFSYSRKEGYFEDVPKDGGYPKKLCFKFGPKSHGWKKV